jgi:hypothetical protein
VADDIASSHEDQDNDFELAEPSHRRRGRQMPGLAGATRKQHRRVRFLYFSLASMAGFVIGSAAVIGGQAVADPTFRPGVGVAAMLVVAAGCSVAVGLFVARLYRGALRRKGLKPVARRSERSVTR